MRCQNQDVFERVSLLIVMPYYYFIGIDVSKQTLAITIIKKKQILLQQNIVNNSQNFKKLLDDFKKDQKIKAAHILCCLENTGVYHELILPVLTKAKIAVCVESSLRIKRSLGIQRGKNDTIDSERIANYAYQNRERLTLWKEQRPVILEMKLLNALRKKLQNTIYSFRLPLEDRKKFSGREHGKMLSEICAESISMLQKALKNTEQRIRNVIAKDERISELFEIVTSVEGIGTVVGVELIVATNEFKNFDSPKKFACYCGVAPFEHSSGTSIRERTKVSKIANQKLKAILHMPAMSAIRSNSEIAQYYKRKVAEGHSKMSVLNAVKYKLINRTFACVKENRLYQKK